MQKPAVKSAKFHSSQERQNEPFESQFLIADNRGDHDFRSLFAENQYSHPEQDHFFAQGGCFIQIY